MAKKSGMKLIANNKKAFHDYFIEDTYEAGIALVGTEVKSLRAGKCSVKESFIRVENGEVYIYGMHISPYAVSYTHLDVYKRQGILCWRFQNSRYKNGSGSSCTFKCGIYS